MHAPVTLPIQPVLKSAIVAVSSKTTTCNHQLPVNNILPMTHNQAPVNMTLLALADDMNKLCGALISNKTKAADDNMVIPSSQCRTASKGWCFWCSSIKAPSMENARPRKECCVPSGRVTRFPRRLTTPAACDSTAYQIPSELTASTARDSTVHLNANHLTYTCNVQQHDGSDVPADELPLRHVAACDVNLHARQMYHLQGHWQLDMQHQ